MEARDTVTSAGEVGYGEACRVGAHAAVAEHASRGKGARAGHRSGDRRQATAPLVHRGGGRGDEQPRGVRMGGDGEPPRAPAGGGGGGGGGARGPPRPPPKSVRRTSRRRGRTGKP